MKRRAEGQKETNESQAWQIYFAFWCICTHNTQRIRCFGVLFANDIRSESSKGESETGTERERVRLLVLVCRFQCFRVFVQRARLLVSGFWCLMVRLEFIIYVFVFQQNAGSGRARKWNDCRRAPKTGLVLPAFSDFEEFSQFFFSISLSLSLRLYYLAPIIWKEFFNEQRWSARDNSEREENINFM